MKNKKTLCGIYTITNKIDKKIYIGYSLNIKKRFNQHKSALLNNRHINTHLQNAVNKFGLESFEFEELIECEKEFLCSEEHYWVTILCTYNRDFGYNILPTHPNKIYSSHSLETCKKISDSKKGKAPRKKGYKLSNEVKNKIRNSVTITHNRRKKVLCINDGKIFNSITEASKFYKLAKTTITNSVNGVKNKNGLKFEFI